MARLFARLTVVGLILAFGAVSVAAQGVPPGGQAAVPGMPQTVTITDITVEGVEGEAAQRRVIERSGLAVGQELRLPGDTAIGEAVRTLHASGVYDDVKVKQGERTTDGLALVISVTQAPRLTSYEFLNVGRSDRRELRDRVPLLRGQRISDGRIERSVDTIKRYFKEDGYLLPEVAVQRTVREDDNSVQLAFVIDRGPRLRISDIVIEGNEELSDGQVRGAMDNTKQRSWWRFWRGARFNEEEFQEDLEYIIEEYNRRGFYDARVLRDTFEVRNPDTDPELIVSIELHEGPRYHVRNIAWEGNTVFSEEQLTEALGFQRGDVFNQSQFEENLFGNRRSSDVSSRYRNQGFMTFNVQPSVRVVPGDSLDLTLDVFEGETYDFGRITIAGNQKTKEHVVRRELLTTPGQQFSQDAIQESVRRLSQLQYFDQQSLAGGPELALDEQNRTVDLTYEVEEVGSDQLELSGTYGRFGVVLQLRFSFNNFSAQDVFKPEAWRPLPMGDGQRLSVGVQTNGTFFQQYDLSFQEPWFGGRPMPVGFSVSHSRTTGNPFGSFFGQDDDGRFIRTRASVFQQRRLSWPDDRFSYSIGTRYQFFSNSIFTSVPQGISQELALQQSLSRNSLDNPLFPRSGSRASLSLDVALPLGDFIQYHKWRFNTAWHAPIARRLTFSFGTDFGYIGSLTGGEVDFERFLVGGSPFDTQGQTNFGSEDIFMRGYPRGSVGPRRNGQPVGGRILNKYQSELRFLAVQSQQLQAAPYIFADAANTFDGFDSYDPTRLYRSAGVGVRMFLPILGMIELAYGYNIDEFEPFRGEQDGSSRWRFQFTIGQGFGFGSAPGGGR